MMSSTLNRFTKVLVLGAIVAAAAAPAGQADNRPVDNRVVGTPQIAADSSDVVSRYLVSHPAAVRPSDDRVDLRVVGTGREGLPSPQQVGIPFYTPKMLAAHYNHEDVLYERSQSIPTVSDTIGSNGFDWTDWAIGLGSGISLILALGGGLAMGRQRRHRMQTA